MGKENFPVETYERLHDALVQVARVAVLAMTRHQLDTRDQIIRNLMARTALCLRGIFALWRVPDPQDCWALFRCLLDRLFHIHYLASSNSFEEFDKWSFLQQYNLRNAMRSDPDFKETLDPEFFKDSEQAKQRARDLTPENPQWTRPFAEEIAKQMDLRFLYKYGYDYGSMFIHPMANDGQLDFVNLTGVGKLEQFGDQRVVLHNSCLAASLILTEGMNASGFEWLALMFNCLTDIATCVSNGSDDYMIRFREIISAGPDFELCRRR